MNITTRLQQGVAAVLTILLLFAGFSPAASAEVSPNHPFPRIANYYLRWDISDTQATELSKWDVIILDMETQVTSKAQLQKIKTLNPEIIILAYITPQEIRNDAATVSSQMRRRLHARIHPDWYVQDTGGQKKTWWPGTSVLNISDLAPLRNGERLNDVMVRFVVEEILSTGLWDGVFYDNAWDGITWFTGTTVDLDLNGYADTAIDASWRNGMKKLYEDTRTKTQDRYIIVGNGTSRDYRDQLNGKMIENFIPSAWGPSLDTYAYNHASPHEPAVNIINANTNNGQLSKENYQAVRFGLGSTLLEDGYFSFDYGDQDHAQLWYYDEYSVHLGDALGDATAQQGHSSYKPDVWQRQFENGVALVNSSANTQLVSLNGEYEKIHGTQDPTINDGSIVSEVALPATDGLILLKTFATLEDVVFTNGHFLRFFRADGSRVRNGFFAFDEAYRGSDQLATVDVNANGKRDRILLRGNLLQIWRDDGQPYARVYPYSADYRGGMRLSMGDLDADGDLEFIIAPQDGAAQPIKIYDHTGVQLFDDWYPLGAGYKGGYSVAIAESDTGPAQVVVGSGRGKEPRVFVYDSKRVLQQSFLAYESRFRGGVNVATGDTNGDGMDEVITGPGKGGKTWVKTFDVTGKHLGVNFQAYETFNFPGVEVHAADVDFDGKDDIITQSEGISF